MNSHFFPVYNINYRCIQSGQQTADVVYSLNSTMTTKKISAHEVVVINFLPLEGRITLKQTDIYSPKLSVTTFFPSNIDDFLHAKNAKKHFHVLPEVFLLFSIK